MDARHLALVMTPEGWELLNSLPPYDPETALSLSARLRTEGVDADLVAAALTQSRLRERARAKFGDFARGMLLTATGLEQATRLTVAALHAERYRRAGARRVADLGCGIGGDAMAMAALGLEVVAVDRDEAAAAAATVNLRFFPGSRVVHAEALEVDLAAGGVEAVYADPARRTGAGRRTFDPGAWSPPLDALLDLRRRWPLGLKVAPGIDHAAIPADAQADWVSVDGDVVECGLWFGPLRDPADDGGPAGPAGGPEARDDPAEDGGRPAGRADTPGAGLGEADGGPCDLPSGHGADNTPSDDGAAGFTATVIRDGRAHRVRRTGAGEAPVGELAAYLYEPDGAVIRAHLVREVAAVTGGHLLNPTIAYVTSDTLARPAWATAYRVVESMPFNLKRLRSHLRSRGVGRVTIKKRGTAVVPDQLRSRLDLSGTGEATIVLTRIGQVQSVILVDPVR